MVRTRSDGNPTFDDPDSFFLNIKTGVIRANIGDIGNFLNAGGVANSPLRKRHGRKASGVRLLHGFSSLIAAL
jgi:hypothetical protein